MTFFNIYVYIPGNPYEHFFLFVWPDFSPLCRVNKIFGRLPEYAVLASVMPDLMVEGRKQLFPVWLEGDCPKAIFSNMSFRAYFEDHGNLKPVVQYLRGSKRLCIPEGWRDLLPTEI